MKEPKRSSRREFLKTSTTTAGAVAALGSVPLVHAAGSDAIKVGLIGCGGRGTGAAENICSADDGVVITSLGDLFPDHLSIARGNLASNEVTRNKTDITDDRCFTGFDAYKNVIDSGVDLVILATPPGFRPMMIEYAIAQGKNLFTEKPVGVDGPGIRRVLAAYDQARSKNLAIVAGTQRRHQAPYVESMKRIRDSAIGDIVGGRCYWNQGALWNKPRESGWSDMEWQVRNWLYFTWLSGDHIVEQHVHNIDVINWALTKNDEEPGHPVRAVGLGGRQVRTQPEYGHIFDHFAIDFEYPGDIHVLSMCRQIPNCENNVSEALVGTKGTWTSQGQRFTGAERGRVREEGRDPYVQEHVDLLASLRAGKPLNELKNVAYSTLSAIMGRMSTYTGKAVTWDEALNSTQDIVPRELAFGPLPVPPVAMPGTTELA
jgi:predicted dehydrogenase